MKKIGKRLVYDKNKTVSENNETVNCIKTSKVAGNAIYDTDFSGSDEDDEDYASTDESVDEAAEYAEYINNL